MQTVRGKEGRNLLKVVMEARYEGERPRARKRKSMVDDLKARKSHYDMKKKAED